MRFARLGCLFLALVMISPLRVMAAELEIGDARIGDAPPAAMVRAAYFTVSNKGRTEAVIQSVSSARADRAEIHRTAMHDGMAMMRMQKRIPVGPGETVSFEPGGLHVMLMGAGGLKVGERVPIELQLNEGRRVEFSAVVLGRE